MVYFLFDPKTSSLKIAKQLYKLLQKVALERYHRPEEIGMDPHDTLEYLIETVLITIYMQFQPYDILSPVFSDTSGSYRVGEKLVLPFEWWYGNLDDDVSPSIVGGLIQDHLEFIKQLEPELRDSYLALNM